MKMRAVVEIWLKSLIDDFTLEGLHSALNVHKKLTITGPKAPPTPRLWQREMVEGGQMDGSFTDRLICSYIRWLEHTVGR